jgi:3-isopropylmalate/(R)-2-methylmalate dehydratase small subunit
VDVAGQSFPFAPYPQGLKDILDDGGLIPHLMKDFRGPATGQSAQEGAPE